MFPPAPKPGSFGCEARWASIVVVVFFAAFLACVELPELYSRCQHFEAIGAWYEWL
jgi:hypothetical protein